MKSGSSGQEPAFRGSSRNSHLPEFSITSKEGVFFTAFFPVAWLLLLTIQQQNGRPAVL